MEQWLEEFMSGWPAEQKREVAEHLEEGRFISFMDGKSSIITEEAILEWMPAWEKEDERLLLLLKEEVQRTSLPAVRLKLPSGLHPAVLRKAALLRGVAVGSESECEDAILLQFEGLSPEQIAEGLERLEEEVSSFTARYES
ncbi:hypothetical protein [Paenibacillus antibioticophila]|uniref:hypothetical protein n=1 Tax=Paenibacillus antibioticophila TaxID=1274374 RepID=UPI0005C910FA|nr:hypothetical protein [Paenibacillus antibioticophila]